MKELYVVAGPHSYPDMPGYYTHLIDVQTDLIKTIALVLGCTGYFEDGMTSSIAESTNDILEKLLQGDTAKIDQLAANERETGEYGLIARFHALAEVRRADVPITALQTEDNLNYHNFLKSKYEAGEISGAVWFQFDSVCRTGDESKAQRYACNNPRLQSIVTKERDSRIVANILNYGRDRNILSIGLSHPLVDFALHDDLTTYRIDILDEPEVIVQGTLPKILQKPITDILETYRGKCSITWQPSSAIQQPSVIP
ncbi:TPA: hypothetical protein HA242_03905 [Candidatus Woesearchaeota archaeon]|nr:hypothetical protein [Candidatus Woesearchaeota archaeon]HIG93088.1 hypothetical protein [Candidatus Woesearchaeota archaeon]HIH12841.1 hypothetical protein [Candidatus Woesearchaeota archaeon]